MVSMDSTPVTDNPSEVTAAQLRAARALLGWSRPVASVRCKVGEATLARLERGETVPHAQTIEAIVRSFEAHGIRFFVERGMTGTAIMSKV